MNNKSKGLPPSDSLDSKFVEIAQEGRTVEREYACVKRTL